MLYAVLSDVDDTLIDSSAVQAWTWAKWAAEHHLDAQPFVVSHGLRIEEKLMRFAPHLSAATEAARIVEIAAACPFGATALPGAADLLATTPRLALVTSGLRAVILPQLRHAGLIPPRVFVTAEDVTQGKPDPEPYLKAARLLGTAPELCVVLEDATAGVRAGIAAGMTVVAVTTTTAPAALREAGALLVVANVAAFLRHRERGTRRRSV
jgi:sugar-phosphatase